MDYTAIVKELMLVLTSLGLGVTSCFAGGCIIHLTGEGEVAAGMRNTNEVYLRHEVDGDKVGQTAEAGVQLEAETWDWINDQTDEDDPGDPDGDSPSGPDSNGG